MQYFDIDDSTLEGIADRNPNKDGSYTLTGIPICSETLGREKADVFLVLPYGFIDEFIYREIDWLKSGVNL